MLFQYIPVEVKGNQSQTLVIYPFGIHRVVRPGLIRGTCSFNQRIKVVKIIITGSQRHGKQAGERSVTYRLDVVWPTWSNMAIYHFLPHHLAFGRNLGNQCIAPVLLTITRWICPQRNILLPPAFEVERTQYVEIPQAVRHRPHDADMFSRRIPPHPLEPATRSSVLCLRAAQHQQHRNQE